MNESHWNILHKLSDYILGIYSPIHEVAVWHIRTQSTPPTQSKTLHKESPYAK